MSRYARPLVLPEHLLPRTSTVGRAIHTTLGAVGPRRTEHTDIHDVWIRRVGQHPVNALGSAESHEGPAVTTVERLEQSTADPGTVAGIPLTRAHPDDIGVWLKDRDMTDPDRRLIVKDWIPGEATVLRPKHTSCGRPHVDEAAIGEHHLHIGDPPAHSGGADRARAHRLEGRLVLRGQGWNRYRE